MDVIDLTMPWDDDCPSYMGFPNPKTYYIKRRHEGPLNAQMLEIPNHNGTHIDGERHVNVSGRAIGEEPIDELVTEGAVVDLSDVVGDYGVYTAEDILDQPVTINSGDALIIHTGHGKYAYNQEEGDLERYFLKHPGPAPEFADWCLEMDIQWLGTDTPGMDHPMNNSLRFDNPAPRAQATDRRKIVEEAETVIGEDLETVFPKETLYRMHHLLAEGVLHAENVGGEIDKVLNERVILGAFPWRMVDVEASPCRIVAIRGL